MTVLWADLNAPGTYKFSDADFLPQFGWNCYDDDSNPSDQRCDSPKLKALLRAQGDQPDPDRNKDDVKLSKRLGDKDVARALRRTICKFPSEWDRTTISQRYHWLNEMEYGFKDHPDDWKRFENHLKAITFEKLPQAYLDAQWHFHPTEFIKLFRKCGWLDQNTFARIYPKTQDSIREKYRIALNTAMRKYRIVTPLRQSHFLGQGAVESGSLNDMQEKSMSGTAEAVRIFGEKINPASAKSEADLGHWYGKDAGENDPWFRLEKYNSKGIRITGSYSWVNGNCGDEDAIKFRGRGFKQLTGRSNYADYWTYRGWINLDDFSKNWWDDQQYKLRNVKLMTLKPAEIVTPQEVTISPYNCIDSGGWYMIFCPPESDTFYR
ncbi:hypothetical protein PQR63_02060 [Herbaspirillum rhizosphaerae]|uniref:Uncharacterized protein n=1 Tax=Herbaspirillum rhizosphaerae TaxID=346179 RepID=A0ABW8Z249_9BURK